MVVILMISGFIYSVYSTYKWPNAAYYLLPTRAWGMLIGGLAYLYPWILQERNKKVIEILGLGLILCSFFFMSESTLWPGYWAAIPVFGTYLIIVSNRNNSILTTNIVSQYLGAWSYSIYLWHWPIVVFLYLKLDFNYSELVGILVSVVMGYFSYRFIEKFKFKSYSRWQDVFKVKPFLTILVLCLLAVLYI